MRSKNNKVTCSAVFAEKRPFWTFIAVLALSLAIALTFGWEFLVQNQNTYLAHAIAELNPGLFSRDWFVSETAPYHWAFTDFVVWVGQFFPLAIILPATLLMLITAPLIALFYLIRRVTPESVWFCFSVVGFWFVLGRTESVGGSYVFDNVLQASSFSVGFMLLALVCFARGLLLLAGILLAISGSFHGNYLLLSLPGFGLALWLSYGPADRGLRCWIRQRLTCFGERRFWVDALKLLAPPLLVFLGMLPGLLGIMADPMSAEGAYIFSHIRSPWHYLSQQFLPDFILPGIWVIAAAITLPQVLRARSTMRRLAGVWAAFAAMIVFAVLLTTVVFVPTVDQLFVWRLTPLVVLCSLLFLAVFIGQQEAPKHPIIYGAGYGVLLVATIVALLSFELNGRVGGLGFLSVLLILCMVRCGLTTVGLCLPGRFLSGLSMVVLLVVVIRGDVNTLKSSTAIHGVADPQQSGLYLAMANTPRDALFLIPPNLQEFRLRARRAVVVDWKSTPYLGSLLVEWHRRIGAVAGRSVVSERDAAIGYSRMNLAHLRRLVEEYGVDYALFERRKVRWMPGWSPFFENERYLVFSVQHLGE